MSPPCARAAQALQDKGNSVSYLADAEAKRALWPCLAFGDAPEADRASRRWRPCARSACGP